MFASNTSKPTIVTANPHHPNGGPGTATSLFLRGAKFGRVPVLVDGVKVRSATPGTTAVQNVPVEQIEIVRGPRSSLHGGETIGSYATVDLRAESALTRDRGSLFVTPPYQP